MSASTATPIVKSGAGYRQVDFRRARLSLCYLATYLFSLAASLFVSPNDTFHEASDAQRDHPQIRTTGVVASQDD